jgi:hypothetical protein
MMSTILTILAFFQLGRYVGDIHNSPIIHLSVYDDIEDLMRFDDILYLFILWPYPLLIDFVEFMLDQTIFAFWRFRRYPAFVDYSAFDDDMLESVPILWWYLGFVDLFNLFTI